MLLNQVFTYLEEIKSYKGHECMKKKHECFINCLKNTKGQVLKLFNPKDKVKLNINESTIRKSLKLIEHSEPISLNHMYAIHEHIVNCVGYGSIKKKIQLISKIFSGVDVIYRNLLKEYYTKTMFKIGFSLSTVDSVLYQLNPCKKEAIKKGIETGLSHYEIYKLCEEGKEIPTGTTIKPMLACAHPIDISKEYYIELKLDGVRLLFKHQKGEYSCWTRSGLFLDPEKVLSIIPLKDKLSLLNIKEDFVLDGELWVPSLKAGEGFRVLLPIIKSKKKIKINAYYHLFDIPYYKEFLYEKPLYFRKKLLDTLNLRIVKYTTLNYEKIPPLLNKLKKTIYEGVVIKEKNSLYEPGKRSTKWLKLKPHPETIDVLITGAQKGTGKYSSYYASFDISILNDKTYLSIGQVGSGCTEKDLKELTERYEKNIPTIIEIQAEAWTNTGALRFPRFIRIRDDKKEPNTINDLKEFMH